MNADHEVVLVIQFEIQLFGQDNEDWSAAESTFAGLFQRAIIIAQLFLLLKTKLKYWNELRLDSIFRLPAAEPLYLQFLIFLLIIMNNLNKQLEIDLFHKFNQRVVVLIPVGTSYVLSILIMQHEALNLVISLVVSQDDIFNSGLIDFSLDAA